jgi:hypothetical protein
VSNGEGLEGPMRRFKEAIAVALLLAAPMAAGPGKLDYGRILRCGCSVDQVGLKAWVAYVWADYEASPRKHDYALWLSNRSTRLKALKDCDEWLTFTYKKQAEARRANGRAAQHP